ncbi:MAG: helix-turn-helix domain-containing protein [Campylobacterales bacterium]|nr:helix-turn-helix domain-containing protein [Campylobacterales bacterium]
MAKFTVAEASEILGITKEAIYNRIRRGTLKSVSEAGVKHVLLEDEARPVASAPKPSSSKPSLQEDRYVELLKEQVGEFKTLVKKLEEDKERLIAEKEALLVRSKEEVERIYKERDKQLKAILSLATRPLLERALPMMKNETIDADFEELTPYEKEMVGQPAPQEWVNLTLSMEKKGMSEKKQKKISMAILEKVGFCEDVKEDNGTLFIKRGKKLKEILGKA